MNGVFRGVGLVGGFWLLDRGAGKNIKMVRVDGLDARGNLVIGSGTNHGGVVTGIFELGEENGEIWEGGVSFVAEDLVGADAAGEDDGLDIGMLLVGELEFF